MEPIKKKVQKSVAGTVNKVRKYIRSLDEEQNEGERDYSKDDFAYPWLNARFLSVLREAHAWKKPSYAWGVVHGAHLASRLDVKKISILEFGVAGGNGLVTLENVGKKVEVTGTLIPAGNIRTETTTRTEREDAPDTKTRERVESRNAPAQFRVTSIKTIGSC